MWVKQPGTHTKTRLGLKKRKATSTLKDNDNDEAGESRKKSKQNKNQAADPASQSQTSAMKQEKHVLKGKSSSPSPDPDEGEKRKLGGQYGPEQQDDPKEQDVLGGSCDSKRHGRSRRNREILMKTFEARMNLARTADLTRPSFQNATVQVRITTYQMAP